MSLKQFFSCCLRSPPSTFLCTYSISFFRRHTPTQFADSSLVVLFLSAFFTSKLHCRKQQGCTPQTSPWYRGRIAAVTGNWGNWLGVTSGFRLEKKKNNQKTMSVSFICSLRGCWIPDTSRLDEVEHHLKLPHLARLVYSNNDHRWRQVERKKWGSE